MFPWSSCFDQRVKSITKEEDKRTLGQAVLPGRSRLRSGEGSSPGRTAGCGSRPRHLEGFRALDPGDAALFQEDLVTELLGERHHFREMLGREGWSGHQELLGPPFASETSLLGPLVRPVLEQATSRRVLEVLAPVLQSGTESSEVLLQGSREFPKSARARRLGKVATFVKMSLQRKTDIRFLEARSRPLRKLDSMKQFSLFTASRLPRFRRNRESAIESLFRIEIIRDTEPR